MQKRWVAWLGVLLGLLIVGGGATVLMVAQEARTLGFAIAVTTGVLVLCWLGYGLIKVWETRWAKILGSLGLSGLATAFIAWVFLETNSPRLATAVVGMWAMALAFLLGLWLIKLILMPSNPVTGIAKAVVDEAVRMKIALVFIIALFIALGLLPAILDPAERLQYRMQTFLTWSMTMTGLLLSMLTVFVACSTICNEFYYKQIFMTMTKPVSRLQYLLGKWTGVMLLNLLLLVVTGTGIYVHTQILRGGQERSPYDRIAVEEQLLVARHAIQPTQGDNRTLPDQVQARIEQLIRSEPDMYPMGKVPPKKVDEIRGQMVTKWHTIPPRGSQAYVFEGVTKAADFGETHVQLRFKPKMAKAPEDEMVNMAMRLNGRPFPIVNGTVVPIRVAADNYHVLDLPLAAADEKGRLHLEIFNINPPGPQGSPYSSITFSPGKDFEVLYRVGTFESNFVRSIILLWLRLACLTMVALTAGTFLGFPVACLMTFMIFFAASSSEYISESLRYYAGTSTQDLSFWEYLKMFFGGIAKNWNEGKYWDAFKFVIRAAGEAVLLVVPSFSKFNPVPSLADGREVAWSLVGSAALVIGLIWTGICALVGWLIFYFRELARVTV